MYQNDIYILHLSDLHIENVGKDLYSPSLKTLIDDIIQELDVMGMEKNGEIIIAISGDIIDRGNYDHHRTTAIRFFEKLNDKLKKKIGNKVRDVILVPGNHDKEIRNNIVNNLISKTHMAEGLYHSNPTAQDEWKLQLESYKGFLSLYNEVKRIFGIGVEIENTFGLEIVELSGINICFLRIDTAWCSDYENTKRRMRIGDYQLQELRSEYQLMLIKKKPKLTIALMHHPLNYLHYEEEEQCYKYFLNENLNVNVIMCGHVHENEANNYFNYNKSLITLTTGASKGQNTELRYSIYAMNIFRNSCDIIMKKLIGNTGKFQYDFELYTRSGGTPPETNKLCYPLEMNIKTSIKIDAPNLIERKRLFLLNEDLDRIPNIVEKITAISTAIDKLLLKHKQLAGDKLENFYLFLRGVCVATYEKLKGCFDEATESRVHFRYYNINKDNYPALCHFPKHGKEKSSEITVSEWDSFIKCVYESGGSLVLSANKVHSNIESDWEDNITLIPCVRKNDFEVTKLNQIRPRLTFCISIKNIKIEDSRILYLLAYFKIDTIMKALINNYIDEFHIDVHSFLEYIKDNDLNDRMDVGN